MEIEDGRNKTFSLEESGFTFVRHETAVKDFFDRDELEKVYYPELAALITKLTRAKRVRVFDHTLRSGDEAEREARLLREPVRSAGRSSRTR